jgi:hypothetical protein
VRKRKKLQNPKKQLIGRQKKTTIHVTHSTHTHTHTHHTRLQQRIHRQTQNRSEHNSKTHNKHAAHPKYNTEFEKRKTKQNKAKQSKDKPKTNKHKRTNRKQNPKMTSIVSLPKDVLAMIFSHLWRIEAKGVVLTCKLFYQVVSSQRFFESNFKHFTIAIIQGAHTAKLNFICTARNQDIETCILKYDHFDTFSSLLSKVQSKDSSSAHVKSLYAYAHTGRMVAFHKSNHVVTELDKQLRPLVLYTSHFTWKELRDKARTWCDIMVSDKKIF